MAESRPTNAGVAIRPTDAMQAYKSSSNVHPHYQVVLDVRGDDTLTSSGGKLFPIVANLPERFHMQFSSSWSAPFAKSYATEAMGKAGGAVSATLNAVGVSDKTKAQSAQVWESSSPLSFSIDMIFYATHNTQAEVRDRHKALLKLAAPSQLGQILIAPGPTLAGQASSAMFGTNSRITTLYIGNYLTLDNVVIKTVGSDVQTLMDDNGIPIAMTINVEVESFYASFTTDDIEAMFNK